MGRAKKDHPWVTGGWWTSGSVENGELAGQTHEEVLMRVNRVKAFGAAGGTSCCWYYFHTKVVNFFGPIHQRLRFCPPRPPKGASEGPSCSLPGAGKGEGSGLEQL